MIRKYVLQLLLLSVLLLFQSCHIQIENDRRIAISGTIVDSAGNPIPNISVRCETQGSTLGAGVSDADGKFNFASLESESSQGLNILVNIKPGNYGYGGFYNPDYGNTSGIAENADYSGKRYFNGALNRTRSNYNLGNIQLNEAAFLTLFLNNVPNDTNTLAYTLEYTGGICQIDITGTNPEENCEITNDYYNQLDANSPNNQIDLASQKGTVVLFKYILNNEPEQTISIPLTNPENTYVFEY